MAKLSNKDLLKQFDKHMKEATDLLSDWREEAYENMQFYNGYQWASADVQELKDQRRPAVTFNRTGPLIDSLVGLEASSRRDVKFLARTDATEAVDDLANELSRWARQEANAEYEEADSFKDCLLTGMGVTHTTMDYSSNEQGELRVRRRNPLDMSWDPYASQRNITDRRWQDYNRGLSKDEFIEIFGDLDNIDTLVNSPAINDQPLVENNESSEKYSNPGSAHRKNTSNSDRINVHEYQYYAMDDYVKIVNPILQLPPEQAQIIAPVIIESFGEKFATQEQIDMETEDFNALKQFFEDIEVPIEFDKAKLRRRRYYRAFIAGRTVLEHDENVINDGFTYNFITGRRDEKDGTFYGVMRSMKDPQLWANKLFSTILHMFASNSKGGLLYEQGVFTNPDEARQEWASPDGMIELEPNGLGKIMPKPQQDVSPAASSILQYSLSSLNETSGINKDTAGVNTQNVSGVAQNLRMAQTAGTTAEFFDNMTLYRKTWGKMFVSFAREYLLDQPRVIRITDDQGAMQAVQMLKDDMSDDYDIIVEDGPTTQTQKQEVFETTMQLMPALANMGIQIPPSIIKTFPYPQDIVNEMIQQLQQQGQPTPEQQQAGQLELQQMEANIEKDKANADSARASADKKRFEAGGVAANTERTQADTQKIQADANEKQLQNATTVGQAQLASLFINNR